MGLPNDLHAAVEHAPPPRYDLDQLIRRGRSRKVRSGVFATVGAFALVGLVLTAGYATAAGFRSAGPARLARSSRGHRPLRRSWPHRRADAGRPRGGSGPGRVRPQPGRAGERGPAHRRPGPAAGRAAGPDRRQRAIRRTPPSSERHVLRSHLGGRRPALRHLHPVLLRAGEDDECAPGEDPNGCAGDRDANGIMYVTGDGTSSPRCTAATMAHPWTSVSR